ncbi:ShlB/FhaC/HecB family hemolysin secretion/activation protein [Candidatus Reidiella endopervernicosa]|uniref:ShlB/FhaC/HecB family hemolysin secretion/activation protein n=1 Tax=Candidatus Reidiella endopervernicosa TaxID=2738883 RepID=A0A6N0HSM6_9GAMM|nr:ShlB/FhaC/HecB family hemolysin secretion/activation protein [Candidatus Reidiella endopervernicosa]QKQ25389.1 ShlB/FhaC/HecB family hemolysin secretion/activation protein [Candidatus Reidiella endopervernicosa]
MLLINDLPGMFARATLSASKSEFGAADLTIHFERDTVSGGVAFDNRGGEALGPLRVVADLKLNNLLSLFERTALMVAQAEGQEMQYASISHEQQLGREGTKIKIDYSALRAEPENLSFIPLEQEVESDSANLIVSHPMIRSRKQNLYLRTGLTMHNGTTRLFGAKMIDEQLRVARLGLTYDRIDSSGATNLIDVEVSQGLNGLGSSENGDLLLSRADGSVDFSKLTLYLARLQPLSSHWSLLATVNGQYAFDR